MVSNAQLDNEKNNLVYQVDTLKDVIEEKEEQIAEFYRENEEKSKVVKDFFVFLIIKINYRNLGYLVRTAENIGISRKVCLWPKLVLSIMLCFLKNKQRKHHNPWKKPI